MSIILTSLSLLFLMQKPYKIYTIPIPSLYHPYTKAMHCTYIYLLNIKLWKLLKKLFQGLETLVMSPEVLNDIATWIKQIIR